MEAGYYGMSKPMDAKQSTAKKMRNSFLTFFGKLDLNPSWYEKNINTEFRKSTKKIKPFIRYLLWDEEYINYTQINKL